MGIFDKKGIVDNEKSAQDLIDEGFNEDLSDMPFKEAKEIILVPNQFDVEIRINEDKKKNLLKSLVGRKVCVGSVMWKYKSAIEKGFFKDSTNNKFFDGFFDDLGMKVIVEKTDPEGIVKITDKTLIKLEKKKATLRDIPENKIIEVSELPDLKNYMKINKITDIIKLAKAGNFINKFKSKSKTIYFVGSYYFEEKII